MRGHHARSVRAALVVLVLGIATDARPQGRLVARPPFLPELGAMTPWELQTALTVGAGQSRLRTCELRESGYLLPARVGMVMTPFWRVATASRVARRAGRPSGLRDIPQSAAQKLVWIVAYRHEFYNDESEEVGMPAAVREVFIRRSDPTDPAEDIYPIWTIHMRGELDVQELQRTYGRRFTLPLTIAAFQAYAFDERNEVVFQYAFGTRDRRARLSRSCVRALEQDGRFAP